MLKFFLCTFLLLKSVTTDAQIYNLDTLQVAFSFPKTVTALDHKALSFHIVYDTPKDTSWIYERLSPHYRSVFGNCYFELLKYDSSKNLYVDITLQRSGSLHPPASLEHEENLLRFDHQKVVITKEAARASEFNILDFIGGTLEKGEYLFKFYLRVGNTFGYDAYGKLTTNSISYIESIQVRLNVKKELTQRDTATMNN